MGRHVSYDERHSMRAASVWAGITFGLGAAVAFTDSTFFGWLGALALLSAACHAIEAEIERALSLTLEERREALALLASIRCEDPRAEREAGR